MNDVQALHYAKEFLHARQSGSRLPLLSAREPALDLAAAERIAALTTELSSGAVVGYKLGYTSQAMRTQMKIDSPNWGRLTEPMWIRSETQPSLVHPRIEPEIAVVMDKAVDGDCSLEELGTAVRSVHLALEIVDTRYEDYRFTLEDNTADASSAAAFMLGSAYNLNDLAGPDTEVTLREDGEAVGRGRFQDVLGGPILALHWLAQELSKRALKLEAGMVVMTGGLTSAALVKKDSIYTAEHSVMGQVQFCWQG